MRRYNYGQNYTAINSVKITELCPVGILEVAPGDTVSGKFTTKTWSDTTFRPILNRTYMDQFAFYVPFRLLWDKFPEFLVQKDDTLVPPRVTANSEFLFERPTLDGATTTNAWQRRAYNLIWNKFFRLNYQPEAAEDSGLANPCSQRETTFHESCLPPGVLTDTDVEIDVSGETVSIDDLREGFAQDRFNKIREYYGDKYTDYLASIGVKASWSISDEPELIGRSNKDWIYRTTNATNTETSGIDVRTGDPAGYYESKNVCSVKPTFCPEHGLIFMVAVARMDLPNTKGNGVPMGSKDKTSDYYSPEYETKRLQQYNGRMFGEDDSVKQEARVYEDYRKPGHLYGNRQSQDSHLLYAASYENPDASSADYRTLFPSLFDQYFTGNMGGGGKDTHFTTYTEIRMLKKSPVRPPQRLGGVS